MGEKLKSPPLLEAICEFRFDDLKSWTGVVPGQLYEKIKGRFPKQGEIEMTSFALNPKMGEVHLGAGAKRIQMRKEDGSAMVQVGKDLLAINHLRPYESWKSFRSMIKEMLTTYLGIIEPCKINRVGLRYINQIQLPEQTYDVAQFITVVPTLPMVSSENPLVTFFQRYEITYGKPSGVMIHQTGMRKESDRLFLMLDMDFVRIEPVDSRNTSGLWDWLDKAHDEIYKVFKETLQIDVYEKLKEGKL